jgi:hypothetical protein
MIDPLNEPIPDDQPRVQWSMAETTWRALLDVGGLNVTGLEHLRAELRRPDWDDLPPDLLERRALLKHDVCEHLAILEPHRRPYYESIGDLMPSAPDDLSALDTEPGEDRP